MMTSSLIASAAGDRGNILAVAIVLLAMWRGNHVGMFRSVLDGLAVVFGCMLAIWLSPAIARWLTLVWFPERFALVTAFVALVTLPVAGMHYTNHLEAILTPARLARRMDVSGGIVTGFVNGLVLASIATVAWSASPFPPSTQSANDAFCLRMGRRLLVNFAHCIDQDPVARASLLHGEPMDKTLDPHRSRQIERRSVNVAVPATEPFVDRNDNGRFDSDESYVDVDGNGHFSDELSYVDLNGNGRRDIGLLERYELGNWDRVRGSQLSDRDEHGTSTIRQAAAGLPND